MERRQATHDPLRTAIAGALDTPAAGPHPEIDDLIRYHGGELPGSEEERVRDHLVGCAECTETLLDLDRFVAAGAGHREAAAVPLTPFLRRGPVLAAAASLVIAVAALAVWVGMLGRANDGLRVEVAELSAPRPDVPIVDLLPDSSVRGEAAGEPVELAPDDGYATLVLTLPGAGETTSFRAEILGPGGAVVWRGPIERSRFGTFTLGLRPGTLPAGESTVRLYGLDGEAGDRLLETYTLRVGGER